MRSLRQLPQLPQSPVNPSAAPSGLLDRSADRHLPCRRVLQPACQIFLPETPLPPDFNRRDLLALRPQTNGACGNAQPAGHRSGGEKWFTIGNDSLHNEDPSVSEGCPPLKKTVGRHSQRENPADIDQWPVVKALSPSFGDSGHQVNTGDLARWSGNHAVRGTATGPAASPAVVLAAGLRAGRRKAAIRSGWSGTGKLSCQRRRNSRSFLR